MSPLTGFHRDFLLYRSGQGSTVELLVLLALDEACTLHADKLGGIPRLNAGVHMRETK